MSAPQRQLKEKLEEKKKDKYVEQRRAEQAAEELALSKDRGGRDNRAANRALAKSEVNSIQDPTVRRAAQAVEEGAAQAMEEIEEMIKSSQVVAASNPSIQNIINMPAGQIQQIVQQAQAQALDDEDEVRKIENLLGVVSAEIMQPNNDRVYLRRGNRNLGVPSNIEGDPAKYFRVKDLVGEQSRLINQKLYSFMDEMRKMTKVERMQRLQAIDKYEYKWKAKAEFARVLLDGVNQLTKQERRISGWLPASFLESPLLHYLKEPFVYHKDYYAFEGAKWKIYNYGKQKYQKKKLHAYDMQLNQLQFSDLVKILMLAYPSIQGVADGMTVQGMLGLVAQFTKGSDYVSAGADQQHLKQRILNSNGVNAFEKFHLLIATLSHYLGVYDTTANMLRGIPFPVLLTDLSSNRLRLAAGGTQIAHLLSQTTYSNTYIHWASRGYNMKWAKASMTIQNRNFQSLTFAILPYGINETDIREIFCIPPGASITLNSKQFDFDDYIVFLGLQPTVTDGAQSAFQRLTFDGIQNTIINPKLVIPLLNTITVTFSLTSLWTIHDETQLVRYSLELHKKKKKPKQSKKMVQARALCGFIAGTNLSVAVDSTAKKAGGDYEGLEYVWGNIPDYYPPEKPQENWQLKYALTALENPTSTPGQKRSATARIVDQWPNIPDDERAIIKNQIRHYFGQRLSDSVLELIRMKGVDDQLVNAWAHEMGLELPYDDVIIRGSYLQKRRRVEAMI